MSGGVNLSNFTNNVANGRALINEHYDAQIGKLDAYVDEVSARADSADVGSGEKEKYAQIREYAKAFRVKAIDEIKRVREKNLKHCETLWSSTETDLGLKFGVRLKHNESVFDKTNRTTVVSKTDLIKRELFSKIFCFVVNVAGVRDMYNLKIDYILIVIEFFLNPTHISILENRINHKKSEQLLTLDERFLQIDLICNEVQEQFLVFKESRNLEFFDEIMRIKIDSLKSLKEICFVREDIRGIGFEDNSLEFPKLKLMDLSGNMIEHISENIFMRMPNLEYIDLSSNQLTLENQEMHAFKVLKNCRFLYISKNPINKLDPSIFNSMKNLEDVAISELNLTDLNGSVFFYSKNLKKLNASANQILSLDKNMFLGITQLTTLSLSNNKIEKIEPDTFSHFSATLKVLRLDENQLSRVDEKWISSLTNLEELDLANNKIEHIDSESFTHMTNLKQLNLGGNMIRHLDEPIFSNLGNLKALRLERNGLQTFANVDVFANLTSLEMLCLNRNELVHLNENLFRNMGNLKMLDLAHNKLTLFNIKILDMTQKLKILVLIYNPIGNYPELEDVLEKHDIRIVDEHF